MKITSDLQRILNIAISLTAEKNYAKLLEKLISECMDITGCDAGTLYILKDNRLEFMIMRNNTMNVYLGGDGNPIDMMPPVELDPKYVCAYSAINKKTVNIESVYKDSGFDWQGPKKYDELTGYHTESILVVPLINHDDKVIGVLQLINALNDDKTTTFFSEDNEKIVFSIASEAAISLSNMILVRQLRDMLYSFISSLTTAIDQRTPYNANHSFNVAKYCEGFANYLMQEDKERSDFDTITDNEREQLVMAALVHDVGKLITPLEIMNKADRLGPRLPIMEMRWKYMKVLTDLNYSEGLLSKEDHDLLIKKAEAGMILIKNSNVAAFLDNNTLSEIKKLKDLVVYDHDINENVEFLTDEELHEMLTEKGTLTPEERKIIEMHVVYTDRILSKISFQDNFKLVRNFAAAHHEYLDGSGYPNGLTKDELPLEVRIMTIADIYDSLTADDRPYKKAVPKDKALLILHSMAKEGKLDPDLVDRFSDFINETK